LEIKEIKAIIDLMTKNGLSEFEMQKDKFKIRICKENKNPAGLTIQQTPAAVVPAQADAPAQAQGADKMPDLPTINSPMVGTFYQSPSPDAPPFVQVGDEVGPDTVVCVIEAMKVMNEIKAETKGVIKAILAENAKPVEFGQPLFEIEAK
jgi:acetyl-CoA carboxylase biotin carboxyl carrier protein